MVGRFVSYKHVRNVSRIRRLELRVDRTRGGDWFVFVDKSLNYRQLPCDRDHTRVVMFNQILAYSHSIDDMEEYLLGTLEDAVKERRALKNDGKIWEFDSGNSGSILYSTVDEPGGKKYPIGVLWASDGDQWIVASPLCVVANILREKGLKLEKLLLPS